jgi:glycosyltransferase involved in cell wall biosynthesis
MRIIFIGGRNIHYLGGIETYMRNLAGELVKMGHEPVVYCESKFKKKEWYNGYLVIHQKAVKSNYLCKPLLGFLATIDSLVKYGDADVYHYNTWAPSVISWLPRIFGKKVVIQWHGLEWKRTKYSPFQSKIIKLIEKMAVLFNPNLIAVSAEQSDFIFSEYGKKCVTIEPGVFLPNSE